MTEAFNIPIGTRALIFSKHYYGVLSKSLEDLDIERYFSILYFLKLNHNCCQQQLCNELAIDKTAMVKVMNYLIKAGYIARKVNKDDRREQIISLTKKGNSKTTEIVNAFNDLDKKMFTDVSAKDKAVFTKVLSAISSNVKELPYDELFFDYKNHSKKTKTKK